MADFHCGYIVILGRPNVGKSTLLNQILGQKVSITSEKPQTTRHRILGIKTENNTQTIYIDTPGLHKINKRALNRYMNRAAKSVIHDVDVIVFVIEALKWQDEDEWVLSKLKTAEVPVILAINKIDKIKDKNLLLPYIEKLKSLYDFVDIIPISAEKNLNITELESVIEKYLPVGEKIFPDDQITDRSEKFFAAEIIREKLMRILSQELPYSISIEIEKFEKVNNVLHIYALIWAERAGQKAIIIGEKGERLKIIGKQARLELEHWFDSKVYLKLWVKIKENWADDDRAMKQMGYD